MALIKKVRQARRKLASSTAHKVPADLLKMLSLSKDTRQSWQDITELARNEWVCWIISAKKLETRKRRIERARQELISGKRRPCCWAGCPHRGK